MDIEQIIINNTKISRKLKRPICEAIKKISDFISEETLKEYLNKIDSNNANLVIKELTNIAYNNMYNYKKLITRKVNLQILDR